MEYNKVQVYGKLFAGGETYWIVSPHPEDLDDAWETMLMDAFFGVNTKEGQWGKMNTEYQGKQLYPTPYAIIVAGTWHIELQPPVKTGHIFCAKPALLEENPEPENWEDDTSLELVGDLFRRDSYRDLDLDFEEDAEYFGENEDAEVEEEGLLVEEG